MLKVTLTCPDCGFFKDLDEASLPQFGTKITCPRCKGHFFFDESHSAALSPPTPSVDFPRHHSVLPPPGPPLEPPPPPSPAVTDRPGKPRKLNFSFAGNASEYFGIWIVNTLLRVITLGIYSPWAKVRRRRYFYSNTLLDDATFDYLADPLAILKGWFVAGLCIGLYSLGSRISPILSSVLMLAFFGIYPWVVVRSRIFNQRNSTHRNIRFDFKANYRKAYEAYLWMSILTGLSLGMLAPYATYLQRKFLVENSSYGTTPFKFHAAARDYYRAYAPLIVILLAAAAIVGTFFFLSPKGLKNHALAFVPIFTFLMIYFAAGIYLPTVLTNITWSGTSIGGHRFESCLRVRDLCWINLSNALAIIFSLGLLAPWAAVRLVRYRLEHLTLTGEGALDTIAAATHLPTGATGEELGDMVGFDLGL